MNNFNFSILEGHLVKDPDYKEVDGKKRCKFTIGTNRSYTDKTGTKHDETSFFDIITWDRLAQTCNTYLKKGKRVLVSGMLHKDIFRRKSGETGQSIYLEGKEVNFLYPAKK